MYKFNRCNWSTDPYAYYYIDDVSVYEIEELPLGLAGRHTAICEDQTDSLEIGLPQISGYQYAWKKAAGGNGYYRSSN